MNFFHFLRPEWLWIIAPTLLLGIGLLVRFRTSSRWDALCDPDLLAAQRVVLSTRRRFPLRAGVIPIGIVTAVALAGPTWHQIEQPVFKSERAVVLVLDLSRATLTPDLAPSRLVRARHKISDLIGRNEDGHNAIVVYAGDAHVVAPLTDDRRTLEHLLNAITPEIMPVRGSRPELGLRRAHELLRSGSAGSRGEIILLTHRVVMTDELDAVLTELRRDSIGLSVLGLGSPEGAPVPAGEGAFVRDTNGTIVFSRLDETSLRDLVQKTGGRYARLSHDDRDIDHLLPTTNSAAHTAQSEQKESGNAASLQWRDEGIWLVLVLIPLLAVMFRRGVLWCLIPMMLLGAPDPASASAWDDLWQRRDVQGYRAFNEGRFEEAGALFSAAEWQAAASYRSGDYPRAAELYQQMEGAQARYNEGNALAHSGQLEAAIAAYDQALAIDGDFAEARDNRDRVQEILNQQKAADPQSQQEQQQQQQQQQQQGDEDSGQQGDEQKGEQNGDQSGEQSGEQNRADKKDPSDSGNESENQDRSGSQDQSGSPDQLGSQDKSSEQRSAEDNVSANDLAEDQQADNNNAQGGMMGEADETDDIDQIADADKANEADTPDEGDEASEEARRHIMTNDDQPLSPEEQRQREQRQATERWLRQIPDDPGRLLRNKFQLESRRRAAQGQIRATEEKW